MTIDAGIKKRFLIRIVDDVGVRAGLTFLLKCLGWSSVDYLSAEEFLEKDNMLIPGCILPDIRMPGMSGLALQQKLFSDGVQLPVVIITGYADVETAVRTLKRGAFDFLEKPIEAEKLDAVLENCWNRWNVKNSGQSPQKIAAIFHEMRKRHCPTLGPGTDEQTNRGPVGTFGTNGSRSSAESLQKIRSAYSR